MYTTLQSNGLITSTASHRTQQHFIFQSYFLQLNMLRSEDKMLIKTCGSVKDFFLARILTKCFNKN